MSVLSTNQAIDAAAKFGKVLPKIMDKEEFQAGFVGGFIDEAIEKAAAAFKESIYVARYGQPKNMREILEGQAKKLVDIAGGREIGYSRGYHREWLEAIGAFVWRPDLAEIGLNRVVLVDNRFSGQFLANAAGVICNIKPDLCQVYQGVEVPKAPLIIQCQFGTSSGTGSPEFWRNNLGEGRQLGTVKEGLFGLLAYGKDEFFQNNVNSDFSGSVTPDNMVPSLCRNGSVVVLLERDRHSQFRNHGTMTRGK